MGPKNNSIYCNFRKADGYLKNRSRIKHLDDGALEREAETQATAEVYVKVRAKPGPLIRNGYFRSRPDLFEWAETQTAVPADPRNGGVTCEALTKALDHEDSSIKSAGASLDPVAWLARRAGITPSMAGAIASANRWGGL